MCSSVLTLVFKLCRILDGKDSRDGMTPRKTKVQYTNVKQPPVII